MTAIPSRRRKRRLTLSRRVEFAVDLAALLFHDEFVVLIWFLAYFLNFLSKRNALWTILLILVGRLRFGECSCLVDVLAFFFLSIWSVGQVFEILVFRNLLLRLLTVLHLVSGRLGPCRCCWLTASILIIKIESLTTTEIFGYTRPF